jgi:hypothetical protein
MMKRVTSSSAKELECSSPGEQSRAVSCSALYAPGEAPAPCFDTRGGRYLQQTNTVALSQQANYTD